MADVPLTAAERRERRMKRILGEGEDRIKKILSGPSGDEQRLPPMLEGGDYKSSTFLLNEQSRQEITAQQNTECHSSEAITRSFFVLICKGVQRIGMPFSLMYGICMRALMEYGLEFNVLIPWLVIFLGPLVPGLIREIPKFVADITDLIQCGNFAGFENVFKRSHAALSFLSVFTSHFMVMVAGFLFTHTGFLLFHQFTAMGLT